MPWTCESKILRRQCKHRLKLTPQGSGRCGRNIGFMPMHQKIAAAFVDFFAGYFYIYYDSLLY